MRADSPVDLLLVEDNPGDVRLTQEALKEGSIPVNLIVVQDGAEAVDFLFRRGRYHNAPRPKLILLDLNLPRKSGREVLSEIKADPVLRRIPVVVMTTSTAEQDIARAYSLNANCYVAKPIDLDAFIDVVHSIEEFWLKKAILPPLNTDRPERPSPHAAPASNEKPRYGFAARSFGLAVS